MSRADVATCKKLSAYAENFLGKVEKKFKLHLDYSEESLLVVDDLISLFFKLRKSHYFTVASLIGSYLGFVIIKNIGGRWSKELTLEKLGSLKGVAQPLNRARRRLANGLQDSFVFYYRSVKLSNTLETDFAGNRELIEGYYQILRQNGWDKKLLSRLSDENEKKYVREESADILGRMGDVASVEPLLALLKDPSQAYFVLIALQGLPDPRSFHPLLSFLRRTRSPVLKMQAALALGALGNPEAAPDLIALLSDSNEILNHYASMGLSSIKDRGVAELLLNAMPSLPLEKQIYAVSALGEIGDKVAVPALIESLFSRDEMLREAAISALQNIPDERTFRPLTFLVKDSSYRIRTFAAYALANFDDSRAVPYIKDLLKDDVQSVRHHADKLLHWIEEGIKPPRCI